MPDNQAKLMELKKQLEEYRQKAAKLTPQDDPAIGQGLDSLARANAMQIKQLESENAPSPDQNMAQQQALAALSGQAALQPKEEPIQMAQNVPQDNQDEMAKRFGKLQQLRNQGQ